MKNNSIFSIAIILLIGGLLYVGINFDKIWGNTSYDNSQEDEISNDSETSTQDEPSNTQPSSSINQPSTNQPPLEPTIIEYTLTFNANGGTITPSNKKIKKGDTYGSLPVPTRNGYTFNGWYTSVSGGSKVNASTVINGNITIYAQWTKQEMQEDYPTSISLSASSGTMYSMSRITLKATLTPSNAKNKTITHHTTLSEIIANTATNNITNANTIYHVLPLSKNSQS